MTVPTNVLENPDSTICWIRNQSEKSPDLAKFAEQQFKEHYAKNQQVSEYAQQMKQVEQEFEMLTAPELHPVTIVHIDEPINGKDPRIEVAGPVGRVVVTVHPDVPKNNLQIGTTGLLTAQKNCLIQANGRPPNYSSVGVFERRVKNHKAIVEHRGEQVVVTLAQSLWKTKLKKGDLLGFDANLTLVAFAKLAQPEHSQLFEMSIPTDNFSELGGLGPVIHLLKRAVSFKLQHKEVAERYKLRRKGGILLIGPPGNGKTKLARCLANYLSELCPDKPARFMSVIASQDNSMWFGQSEKNLRDRFDAAREAAKIAPVILFFDEFDSIAKRRGLDYGQTVSDRVENTLLALMDGVQQVDNLIIVAATNRADTLDPAMVRPGRLDQKVEVSSPNREAAKAILNRYLKIERPTVKGFNTAKVAENILDLLYHEQGPLSNLGKVKFSNGKSAPVLGSELISGAIIEGVVNQASEEAADREVLTGEVGLRELDLHRALQKEFSSILKLLTPENVKCYLTSIPGEVQPVAVEVRPLAIV